MNNLEKIKPFRCICMTIGNLPTAYFESMSYYECLTFLVKFLENDVIPTVNNNSEVVKELQNYVEHYFDNLDVQEEINNKLDDMAESGELADIIAQYLQLNGVLAFNTKADLKSAENIVDGSICKTLGDTVYNDGKGFFYKIREILNTDVVDEVNILSLSVSNSLIAERIENYYINSNKNEIDKLKFNLNLNTIKDTLYCCPLLVIKQLINGTSGDSCSLQGMAVDYFNNEPNKIYLWADYSTYARLYVVTCGDREDGTGWSYTYTDSLPNVHGSCLSLKDGYLLVGDVENGNGNFLKVDLSDYSYEYVTIDGINTYILGVVWDEESQTYLVCANNNIDMYVLDNNLNIISHYSHDVAWIQDEKNYTMQAYDYKNGYEIRSVSTDGTSNMIMFIDTETGKVIKTSDIGYINGEVEAVSYNNGFVVLSFNSINPGLNLIHMHGVVEAYIGGLTNNDLTILQDRKMLGWSINVGYGLKACQLNPTIKYENNYSDNTLIRYCGTGTSDNPIKSGLALSTYLTAWSMLYSGFIPTIDILSSSNGDDNGINITGRHNIDKLYINGNSNTISYLGLSLISFDIINVDVSVSGTTRRTNGQISLYDGYGNCRLRGTNTCNELLMENNAIIGVFDTGVTSTDRSFIRRNVIVGFDKISGSPVQDYENIKMV